VGCSSYQPLWVSPLSAPLGYVDYLPAVLAPTLAIAPSNVSGKVICLSFAEGHAAAAVSYALACLRSQYFSFNNPAMSLPRHRMPLQRPRHPHSPRIPLHIAEEDAATSTGCLRIRFHGPAEVKYLPQLFSTVKGGPSRDEIRQPKCDNRIGKYTFPQGIPAQCDKRRPRPRPTTSHN